MRLAKGPRHDPTPCRPPGSASPVEVPPPPPRPSLPEGPARTRPGWLPRLLLLRLLPALPPRRRERSPSELASSIGSLSASVLPKSLGARVASGCVSETAVPKKARRPSSQAAVVSIDVVSYPAFLPVGIPVRLRLR